MSSETTSLETSATLAPYNVRVFGEDAGRAYEDLTGLALDQSNTPVFRVQTSVVLDDQ
jgi:hypothetical protein